MGANIPIRIAHIIGKMWAGGVEAVVFNYYHAIDKSKIQFDFFYDADSTVEPPADIISMGAKFYKLPPYQNVGAYIKELKCRLRENHYIIVHSHLNTLSIIPLFVAWKVGVPIRIAHNHSVPGGIEWKRNVLKEILRCFAKVFSTDFFSCSEKTGRWMFGNKNFESGNVYLMKNAVDFARFRFDMNKRTKMRMDYNLNGRFVVGHVGRLTYAKNHKLLLEIFIEILKKDKNAILFLVGDGELKEAITNEIKNLKIEHNVVMAGQTNTPEMYYSLFDVMIIPSVFEGLSLTTIEAQVNGRPTLISEAIPDEAIISDGVVRCSLNDGATLWAEKCMEIAYKKIELSEKCNDYSIDRQAKRLCKWYLKKFDKE